MVNEIFFNDVNGGIKMVSVNSTDYALKEDDFYESYVIMPSVDPACLEPN